MRVLLGLGAAFLVAGLSGCSGSSVPTSTGPTTSFPYLIDPLEPGNGFIQLGTNRYPFSGVICTEGPSKKDPPGSTRIFGVYANFTVDGSLAAVALTSYRNELHGATNSVPTITQTALIQMQAKTDVKGLSAKRFRVVGQANWQDPVDPSATSALITRKGDRYEARGLFGPVGDDTTVTTVHGGTASAGSSSALRGEIAARCPAGGSSTSVPPSTGSASSTSEPAS